MKIRIEWTVNLDSEQVAALLKEAKDCGLAWGGLKERRGVVRRLIYFKLDAMVSQATKGDRSSPSDITYHGDNPPATGNFSES